MKWNTTKILAAGFALIILIGAVILCLPISSRNGQSIPFLNALFTAGSATCVTGLVMYDTYTQFSFFGQLIILILIQIGGLGFMAVAVLIPLFFGRRIGLRERSLLADIMGSMQLAGTIRMVRRMLIGTALFEGGGAILLAIRFVPAFGWSKGIWFSIFHAVSAFCNAGFDLMGTRKPSSSLTYYYNDPLVILVISVLIIIGGLGFIVWSDLCDRHFNPKHTRLHTNVVIIFTLELLLGGTVIFWLLERNGAFAGMSSGSCWLSAFFQSVTCRTAGFNSVDLTQLSDASIFISILLMLIGAAPGGTGGGIKLTTIVIIAADGAAQRHGREDTNVSHYRISPEMIRKAYCSAVVYLSLLAFGVFVLTAEGAPLKETMFEVTSAIGTVGLSMGITSSLPVLSKIVLILLMYLGRVGSLTVFMAVTPGSGSRHKLKNPIGTIITG